MLFAKFFAQVTLTFFEAGDNGLTTVFNVENFGEIFNLFIKVCVLQLLAVAVHIARGFFSGAFHAW